MNPDTGTFHQVPDELKKLFAEKPELAPEPPRATTPASETLLVQETAEDKLVRAATKAEEALLRCPELPPHWPKFALMERVHLKGHTFVIDRIEQDALVLKLAPKKEKP